MGTFLQAVRSASEESAKNIEVHLSYEIIRLFSEGLYQSPHKAVEELVSNGYDANADSVHILLPDEPDDDEVSDPLWVIDNGDGMDAQGFELLWRVADSTKTEVLPEEVERPPIGQFGIGKLAAYVLAWRLTHVSRVNGSIRLTTMNFRDLTGKHQYEDHAPVIIKLKEVSERKARSVLADVEERDPAAWKLLFGDHSSSTWTAAAMSDFKNLYNKLSSGRLSWVLRTGLPLHSNFKMWLNGSQLDSSKSDHRAIAEVVVGSEMDKAAADMDLQANVEGIVIKGLAGKVTGKATVFEKKLTTGKSEQYGRSHGFFVRVRGRVINLEDELFGLDALNHAAWSRFAMEIEADGLREYLLSSREGVRENESIRTLRQYLHRVFNICRSAYGAWQEKQLAGLDLEQILADQPSQFITEPLIESVRKLAETHSESYYIARPQLPEGVELSDWLSTYGEEVRVTPFDQIQYVDNGPYNKALRYVPHTRTLMINTEHPFVVKLLAKQQTRAAATLFGSSEVLMDILLKDYSLDTELIFEFMRDRDRQLRLLAGDQPSTAKDVLRRLEIANEEPTALERAVGNAFRVLGFEYEPRGGSEPGPDGVLYARLGRMADQLADYSIVYDAKQTNQPAVPADKLNLDSLDDFRRHEDATFAFFVASAYQGEEDPESKINRIVRSARDSENGAPRRVTLLKINHVMRLVNLHYRYGVTLASMRALFERAHTVPEVDSWLTELAGSLSELDRQVPVELLLQAVEEAKSDQRARPNVNAIRVRKRELEDFTPDKLTAALRAVETLLGKRWLEVDRTSGDIRLYQHADQVYQQLQQTRHDVLGDSFGKDS